MKFSVEEFKQKAFLFLVACLTKHPSNVMFTVLQSYIHSAPNPHKPSLLYEWLNALSTDGLIVPKGNLNYTNKYGYIYKRGDLVIPLQLQG